MTGVDIVVDGGMKVWRSPIGSDGATVRDCVYPQATFVEYDALIYGQRAGGARARSSSAAMKVRSWSSVTPSSISIAPVDT